MIAGNFEVVYLTLYDSFFEVIGVTGVIIYSLPDGESFARRFSYIRTL